MLIAAIEVDNNQLMVAVIGVLGTLFALYSKMRAWEKSVRTGDKVELKQPLDVMVQSRPFTKDDHSAICGPLHVRVGVLESDVRAIRAKMDQDKTEIIDAGETRMRKIHERVDTVLHAVARVEGAIEQMRADHR